MSFNAIRPKIFNYQSTEDIVKTLVPEPDPKILQRLISHHSSTDFSIRMPWQRSPQVAYYDLEDLKFYARILTMLAALGIYPPAEVLMGGGGNPMKIVGSKVLSTFEAMQYCELFQSRRI